MCINYYYLQIFMLSLLCMCRAQNSKFIYYSVFHTCACSGMSHEQTRILSKTKRTKFCPRVAARMTLSTIPNALIQSCFTYLAVSCHANLRLVCRFFTRIGATPEASPHHIWQDAPVSSMNWITPTSMVIWQPESMKALCHSAWTPRIRRVLQHIDLTHHCFSQLVFRDQ